MNSPEGGPPAASPLEPWKYQDMLWCANTGGPQIAIAVYEIESGRLAVCLGCGEEKFLPFSRSTGRAA